MATRWNMLSVPDWYCITYHLLAIGCIVMRLPGRSKMCSGTYCLFVIWWNCLAEVIGSTGSLTLCWSWSPSEKNGSKMCSVTTHNLIMWWVCLQKEMCNMTHSLFVIGWHSAMSLPGKLNEMHCLSPQTVGHKMKCIGLMVSTKYVQCHSLTVVMWWNLDKMTWKNGVHRILTCCLSWGEMSDYLETMKTRCDLTLTNC